MSWARRDPRLDLGSLLDAAGVEPEPARACRRVSRAGTFDYNDDPRRPVPETATRSIERVAVELGTTGRTLHRCAKDGLSPALADQCATALGLHPANIWPAWYEVAEDHAVTGRDQRRRRRSSNAA